MTSHRLEDAGMIGRLATALILFGVPAGYVAAQDAPAGGDGFCATAPQELLVALDGGWSLRQGPGIVIGGPRIPLPAHPPVAVSLQYNSEGGYAILSAQGQEMIMLPTSTDMATTLLGGMSENFVTSTEGMNACDWYALPTLVGTSVYDLTTTRYEDRPPVASADICFNDVFYVFDLNEVGLPVLDPIGTVCQLPVGSTPGEMTMTVALKFDSPSSARGMLHFQGKTGEYPFAAWAPITLSR
jgi:hypothetical protein